MNRHHGHLLGHRIRLHHAKIRDQPRRPLGPGTLLRPIVAAGSVPERGYERQLVDERSQALRHGDEHLLHMHRDLGRTATARQPHLRLVIIPDHRRVEVREPVDLRTAEKTDRDPPALQPVAKHLRHRHGRQRRIAQLTIADRQRQHLRLGADRPGLVDQRDLRRMCQPRQIARRRWRPDADEADIRRLQRPRRRDRHHFRRGVGSFVPGAHLNPLTPLPRMDRHISQNPAVPWPSRFRPSI